MIIIYNSHKMYNYNHTSIIILRKVWLGGLYNITAHDPVQQVTFCKKYLGTQVFLGAHTHPAKTTSTLAKH